MNIHKTLQRCAHNVKTVLFVSTDKACLPITVRKNRLNRLLLPI